MNYLELKKAVVTRNITLNDISEGTEASRQSIYNMFKVNNCTLKTMKKIIASFENLGKPLTQDEISAIFLVPDDAEMHHCDDA